MRIKSRWRKRFAPKLFMLMDGKLLWMDYATQQIIQEAEDLHKRDSRYSFTVEGRDRFSTRAVTKPVSGRPMPIQPDMNTLSISTSRVDRLMIEATGYKKR